MQWSGASPVGVDGEATAVEFEVHIPEEEAAVYGNDTEEEENQAAADIPWAI
jgi:hypothetical protein